MSLFNKRKLERKQKLAELICQEKVEPQQIVNIDQDKVLKRTTRQCQGLKNFAQNCFF